LDDFHLHIAALVSFCWPIRLRLVLFALVLSSGLAGVLFRIRGENMEENKESKSGTWFFYSAFVPILCKAANCILEFS
jgi:hypothetical protein